MLLKTAENGSLVSRWTRWGKRSVEYRSCISSFSSFSFGINKENRIFFFLLFFSYNFTSFNQHSVIVRRLYTEVMGIWLSERTFISVWLKWWIFTGVLNIYVIVHENHAPSLMTCLKYIGVWIYGIVDLRFVNGCQSGGWTKLTEWVMKMKGGFSWKRYENKIYKMR